MNKANDPHKVTIILRDWSKSKTKKGNTPVVAETHNKGGKLNASQKTCTKNLYSLRSIVL